MKLSVLVFIALLSVAKAQETTSVSDAADTTAETTTITAESSTAPSAITTETTTETTTTTTTTASSIETSTSQVSESSLPSISTTSSNCRDVSTLCSEYKQLCQVPERCKKPHGSGSGSGSGSKSDESGSGEKGKKSKEQDRHARSTETDSDDDEVACDWVRQQQHPSLSQVNAECAAYTASPLQFSVGGRVDNGPGRKQGGGGRPNRAPLDCRFREIIAKFYRLLCPLTCGACK